MWRVRLTNFGFFLDQSWQGARAALAAAKDTGFECDVYQGNDLMFSVSPLRGVQHFHADSAIDCNL